MLVRKIAIFLLGVGLVLGLTGCGRKGPPKPLRPKTPVWSAQVAVDRVQPVQKGELT